MSQVINLWGGIECTVNRVGEIYFDQLEKNGHSTRISDLELFSELGLKTMRYPVVWERTAPDLHGNFNWKWSDERLKRLQELDIKPIIGLLHHGSGPRYTSLLDPEFPEKFAFYAASFAKRYPWVEFYTPINEPLTTARFSCLYGYWYPHHKNDTSFIYSFLNQCKAIRLAMQEIRKINPQAKLVQTEEVGKVFSTEKLKYQADFENERRWLTFDILSGRFNKSSYLWKYFKNSGINHVLLNEFIENPCPPDILGINHYVTSERYLDHRIEYYPKHIHGGNGKDRYVDVEAIRIHSDENTSLENKLKEAWQRYNIPIAITEAHLGCTCDEQMRWLKEVWDIAVSLQTEGIDIRAVTSWAILGSYNWNSLVTQDSGHYEPGAFKIINGNPEATGIAKIIKSISNGREVTDPILELPGWWRKPERIIYKHTHPDYIMAASRRAASAR